MENKYTTSALFSTEWARYNVKSGGFVICFPIQYYPFFPSMSYVGIHRLLSFKRIGLPIFLGKFGITFMSTGLPRLRMAIVKLNKLQHMSENMSQLLSNETHMPKNLYQIRNVIRKQMPLRCDT